MKPVTFLGDARKALRRFPIAARREAGFLIDLLQHGEQAPDWKPMTSIGPGVAELRIRDSTGAFRVIYVAKFEEAVYVLHAFQKKTQRTAKGDIELARDRYRELLDMRKQR
jgi:phage-related protein